MDSSHKVTLSREILLDSVNIADEIIKLDDGQSKLDHIGSTVCAEYDEDKRSRSGWEKQMSDANKLALQVVEDKSFPWPNSSNVKFPLVTIAALQFSSRVAPAFMSGPRLVKCAINGKDAEGKKKARADRISQHMTHQLRRENDDWEEDHDRMLFALPIVGCTFKKSYYDGEKNCSEYVLPDHMVISYRAKFNRAERKTHRLFYTPRQVKERQLRGTYLDIDLSDPVYRPDAAQTEEDEREGTVPQHESLHEILEQHRFLDLDGDDYAEPYVVTVNKSDQKVLRIVARYDEEDIETDQEADIKAIVRQLKRDAETVKQQGAQMLQGVAQKTQEAEKPLPPQVGAQVAERAKAEIARNARDADAKVKEIKRTATIIKIKPVEYFTKYGFIPNPFSGVYDIGLGALLGPINKTINTAINQLLDAGTLANAGGGWFGRGAKRKGSIRVAPGVWTQTSIAGKDLAQNIVPYPTTAPSPVLFQLVGLLINYAEKVASVTDMMTGETPGQNTPATTAMASLEQGMKVFQGIFKRVFRSSTREFRKLYLLNRKNLDIEKYIGLLDGDPQLLSQDYEGDEKDIEPVADESMITDQQRMMKAQFLQARSESVGGYDPVAVELRTLESVGITDINDVYPTQDGKTTIEPPPNMELEMQMAEEQRRSQEASDRAKDRAGKLQIEAGLAQLKMAESQVNMQLTAARAKKEGIEADLEPIRVQIEAFKAQHEAIMGQIAEVGKREDSRMKNYTQQMKESSNGRSRAMAGPSGNGEVPASTVAETG